MSAHRRINPGTAVKPLTHAVQTLHLELPHIQLLGHVLNSGVGVGVVGGKLWVNEIGIAQHQLRATQV